MDVPTVRPVKAGWWNVLRPWTLHGAVVPVLIGGVVAMTVIEPEWIDAIVFALIMLGSCLFQCVANILNTYGDFVKGTDTVENETRSPELVTGVLKPKDVLMAGMVCLFIICIIGIVLMFHVGIGLMVYGLLGIFGVTMYTMGASYKYHGMGQISVFINFGKNPTKDELIDRLVNYTSKAAEIGLPHAPKHFIQYLTEDDRPQVLKDVDYEDGMGVSIGRLREDSIFDWKFVGLAHNTLRGAAGGALESAEMLKALGYISAK